MFILFQYDIFSSIVFMTTGSLTTEISSRICSHMNHGHKEAIKAYARQYGGIENPQEAKMISLTSLCMEIEVDGKVIQISFDHQLHDSEDAHRTLVSMLKAIPKAPAQNP